MIRQNATRIKPSTNRLAGVGVCKKRIIQKAPKGILEILIIKQGGRIRTQEEVCRKQESLSSKDAVFEQEIECSHAVLPGDLLALFVRPSVVGAGDFVDAALLARRLDRHFRLEAEAVRGDVDLLDDLATKELVANFHVAQVQVGQQVRQKGEELVDLE